MEEFTDYLKIDDKLDDVPDNRLEMSDVINSVLAGEEEVSIKNMFTLGFFFFFIYYCVCCFCFTARRVSIHLENVL